MRSRPPACSGRSCPKRYGGYEIDMQTFVDIGLAVAHADPSMGWITTFYMEHNWLLTMFSEELQDEIFGAQPFVLAPGSVNPTGLAVPQPDGGYLLNGHWQFGTGICHADWVLLSGKVDGDEPPVSRNFLGPVDDVEVKDTWHVDGMAATGSRDIVATDVFVPERRISLPVPPRAHGRTRRALPAPDPDPADALAHRGMPAVGAAQRALELFEALMFERIQFGTTRTQSNRVPTQVRLANLLVEVDAAETLIREAAPSHPGPRRRARHDSTRGAAAAAPRDRARRAPLPRRGARDPRLERRVGALPRQRAATHPSRRPHDLRPHRVRRRPGGRRRGP